MSIQWFPGHMAKARRILQEQLKWVDVAIELGDARVPQSSRNPLLQELLGGKPKLVILNKADLADPAQTERWLAALRATSPVYAVSAVMGTGVARIVPMVEKLAASRLAQLAGKGIRPRPVRVMVVGIPNTGKSSLINQLAGGSKAKTGNKPGVTRGNQWIRVHERVELLDTPGILWPKFEDPEVGRRLAATGAVRDEVVDAEDLARWVLAWLEATYPADTQGWLPGKEAGDSLEAFGRKRGCLVRGGEVDLLKAAQVFLREFRQGRLGRFTLDRLA